MMSFFSDIMMIQPELVPVTVAGHTLYLKSLSEYDHDRFEAENEKTKDNFRARYVQLCLVNQDGSPALTKEQAIEWGKNPGSMATLSALFNKAWGMSHLTQKDEEDLLKN